jgi:hypothetical protein
MDLNASLARACEEIPGLVRAALVLLPEGLLLGGVGDGNSFDYEPLVRSTAHCLSTRGVALSCEEQPAAMVEFVFVVDGEFVVIQAGRKDPRLALAAVCTRETNLSFALTSMRRALLGVEDCVSLEALGV